jgi:Flp pilus assembly protein TadD
VIPRVGARKRPLVTLGIALLVLAAAAAALLWHGHSEPYVSGTGAEGLTDSLGRAIPADHPKVVFTDVAEEAGIHFEHAPFARTNRLPEDMGSGVALADVDGDGWTDVFLVNLARSLHPSAQENARPAARCALYRNRGDGSFEDVSVSSGLDLELSGNGAAFFDADSDGDLDLLVSSWDRLVFLVNDGQGHFTDATAAAGLADLRGFWTGIAIGDYDRDGAMDAYVCGYVRWTEDAGGGQKLAKQYDAEIPSGINPSAFPPERNLLLHNRGDGTFTECAAAAGVANLTGRSLGVTFADLSGDGWPDLYVANDVSDNAFFVNRHDGTFADLSAPALVADYRGAMGLGVADFDGDGDLDFTVTHWVGQENALYVNHSTPADAAHPLGNLVFMDDADRYGLGASTIPDVGWATGFFDFDNDGVLDLFVVNGSTIPESQDARALKPQRSQLFWNRGGRKGFFSIGPVAGAFWSEKLVGRGGALFDYDLDGDEDLVVQIHGGRARLLRNDGGDARASIRVRLRQPTGNRFAIGARLELAADGRTQFAELDTQGSYLSQHAVGEQAFGLGDAQAAERLSVTWPDGTREECGAIPGRSLVTWTRGSAPRIEPLPGRRARFEGGPKSVEDKRRFYALLADASTRRLAGQFPAAEALYRQALGLWPGHTDALYYLANCLWEEQRVPEALAVLDDLLRADPNQSRAWMQLGTISLLRQDRGEADLARAEKAFAESHRVNGEESLPVVRMGVVAWLRGDLERADKHFADALVLNAQSVEAAWYRGAVAWKRGDAAQAGEWLAQARELAKKKQIVAQPTLHEGGTKSGAAMVSATPAHGDAAILRWSSTTERTGGADEEYGPR